MQVTTKNIVIGWAIIIASGCFGYWIGATTNKLELDKVIEWNTRHIQSIGCLLYTSPSPRDGLLSRMPSSA